MFLLFTKHTSRYTLADVSLHISLFSLYFILCPLLSNYYLSFITALSECPSLIEDDDIELCSLFRRRCSCLSTKS